jgi:hypothetical protein
MKQQVGITVRCNMMSSYSSAIDTSIIIRLEAHKYYLFKLYSNNWKTEEVVSSGRNL